MTTLQRTILILCLLEMASLCALAVVPPLTSINFAWDKAPSHLPDTTYELQWGSSTNSASTNFYNNTLNVGTNLTCTVTNPTTGYLYFRCVAVDTKSGLKSEPSNVVLSTNYPAAPLQLNIQGTTTSAVQIEGQYPGSTNWIHLATVENEPVSFRQSTKSLLMRAKLVGAPPLP